MGGTTRHNRAAMPEATISAAGMRIVRLLVGNEPQTVAQMIRATGVTRTAITEQLHELVAAGFVERATERLSGRGRPRHLYTATRAALLLLFASNQQILVPCIWRAIDEIGGQQLTQQVVERVSVGIAEHYRRRIHADSPQERLRQMSQLLNEEGSVVEVEQKDGQLIMRRRACPFISMFEESRAVCRVDQRMMDLVVGAPVRQTACRHDGAPCCTFELVSSNGK